jgi:hypothetical protein
VLQSEGTELGALQIEDAYEPVLKQERNNQFGTYVVAVGELNVTLVQTNVVDTSGNAGSRSVTGDSFEERNGELNGNGFLVMLGERALQVRTVFIPDHDHEEMIVNEFFNPVGNSLQQLVSGQDGSQFTSDVKRTARVWSCSKLGTADRFGCADA